MNPVSAHLISGALLVLGALPLLVYPAVLVANVMQIAAPRTDGESRLHRAVRVAFLAGTTVYPVLYLLCCFAAIRAGRAGAFVCDVALASVPPISVAVLAGLFALLLRLERPKE